MTDSSALMCRTVDSCRLAEALNIVLGSPDLAGPDSPRALLSVHRDDLLRARDALRRHDENGAR